MTDRPIPESILKAARNLIESTDGCRCGPCFDAIARALMARDERAARIARDRTPATQDVTSTFIAEACDAIASAILSEGE